MGTKSPYISLMDILKVVGGIAGGVALIAVVAFSSIATILTTVFVILKVLEVITFGWLWVLSPVWIILGIPIGVGLLGVVCGYTANFFILLYQGAKKIFRVKN